MRALVSVYDKTNIIPFCKKLHELGVEIISTGGTGKLLNENNIPFLSVEEVTKNKEAFGGRMKTISFEIMSAILFRRENLQDQKEIVELNITPIDMVVCNLYRFSDAIKNNYDLENTIELIDIGGPTMIRSAAKNYKSVSVVTDPADYDQIADELLKSKKISTSTNMNLSLKALSYTAAYDLSISNELSKRFNNEVSIAMSEESKTLRYGENPHQKAKLLVFPNSLASNTLATAPILQGKEISYNNYLDTDAAYKCMSELHQQFPNKASVVIVKHGTPCGAAVGDDSLQTLSVAWECDNVSAFGGIIAFNCEVGAPLAQFFDSKFVEVILAPSFTTEARELFGKKKNIRLVELKPKTSHQGEKTVRSINGGFLIQDEDEILPSELNFKLVTKNNFEGISDELILFGQTMIKYKKSNCLLLANEENGIYRVQASGVGQPNRLHCLSKLISTNVSKNETKNSVLFSDAFFPFADSIEEAQKLNIKYIVQPGGSIKDNEVIAKCDELSIAMKLSNSRHFRH